MRDFQLPGRSPVFATNGVCATSHPIAAQEAVHILKAGGNAADAAIAAAFLLGICEPQMTGLGGDCFILFKQGAEDQIRALNGSGRAPAGVQARELRAAGHKVVPLHHAHAVTIPTAVDAFCRFSSDWGTLGLDRVLEPAIRYAEEGVPVAPRVAFDWQKNASVLSGQARSHYLIDGKPPQEGQLFRSPGQAEVLRRIATHGRAAFYEGEVAEDMVAALQSGGGAHELSDFAAAQSFYSEPISGTYKGVEIFEHPPNGQGATAILMLNILKHFDISALDSLGAARIHIEAEAAKLAYDLRNKVIADPSTCHGLDEMLSSDTAAKLAEQINPASARSVESLPLQEATHKDTVYLTVVDRDRMAVSLIYSIYHGFGSGIASEKFGILMQNRGAGFTLEPGHPNEMMGGKRPMHTIIPAMLKDEASLMPFGVMGGAYQPNGHARVVSNLRDYGMDAQSAIDAPRSFADSRAVMVERGYPENVRAELAAMGHRVEIPEAPLGGGQAIVIREDGILEGASDPRKDGMAVGY